ncbi:DUF4375 domain-containing protein [Pseudoduganella sp. FT26W]|uniref:DUF4375 domain-containing protein n=1 Tax=Duganella aquatilis TaxID=2666082 RepID=A0A844CVF3_9BURK|nr:DUF4375 domain-containing protein [Duganella aquatilis]MRW84767.1 DUF4375 domain-containing protein [Duganella aquatilis]
MANKKMSLDELMEVSNNLHTKSPAELLAIQEELFASLPPEVREAFAKMKTEADARPPRPTLTEISAEALSVLSGEDLDLAVYEYVERQLSNSTDRLAALRLLPRGLQLFYLSFIVEVEVMNGGLHQFFWNLSFDMAELIVPALRELQAREAADIFEQAVIVAVEESPTYRERKKGDGFAAYAESNAKSELSKFNDEFCSCAEKFRTLRATFLQSHEEQFLSPGST